MSSHNEFHTFTFDANNDVLRQYEVEGSYAKAKSARGTTFDSTLDADGTVVSVTATKTEKGEVKTKIYGDADGDGQFIEALEIEVANGAGGSKLEKHQFTFDAMGEVVGDKELKKGHWVSDRIGRNESFDTINIDGTDYVVKLESGRDGVEFNLFRDDNNDGIFTQIAEGEVSNAYLNNAGIDPSNTVSLVGVAAEYLVAADLIIG